MDHGPWSRKLWAGPASFGATMQWFLLRGWYFQSVVEDIAGSKFSFPVLARKPFRESAADEERGLIEIVFMNRRIAGNQSARSWSLQSFDCTATQGCRPADLLSRVGRVLYLRPDTLVLA